MPSSVNVVFTKQQHRDQFSTLDKLLILPILLVIYSNVFDCASISTVEDFLRLDVLHIGGLPFANSLVDEAVRKACVSVLLTGVLSF